MSDPSELLDRWRQEGLITQHQLDAIREFESRRQVEQVPPPRPAPVEAKTKPEPPLEPVPSPEPRHAANEAASPPRGPIVRHAIPSYEEVGPGPQPSTRRTQSPHDAGSRPHPGDEWDRPVRGYSGPSSLMEKVLRPPFASRPPFRLDMRLLGVVLALLASVALLGGLLSLFLSRGASLAVTLQTMVQAGASVLGMVGGYRMAGGERQGKLLVVASLAINALAEIVLGVRELSHPDHLFLLVCWAVLYYLVVISRPGRGSVDD